MTHTINETAEIKEQLEIIKDIHEKVVDAVDRKPYACAMSAMTQIMVELYNHHTENAGLEDFVNKMAAVYMADQMVSRGDGMTKQ